MPYNDVPQAPQRFSATQPLIRENFNIIDASFQINHVDFADGDFGKHIKADFINSAAHPAVAGTDFTIYNFVNPTTANQELYVKRIGGAGAAGTPFTAKLWTPGTLSGWTYLPSGILLKYGFANVNGDQDIVLNAAPFFNLVYNVQLTCRTNNDASNNKTAVLRNYTNIAGGNLTLKVTSVERLTNNAVASTVQYFVVGE